jgi:hypothetical protein
MEGDFPSRLLVYSSMGPKDSYENACPASQAIQLKPSLIKSIDLI